MTGTGHDDLHVVGEADRPWRVVLLHGHAGSPEALLEPAVALADAAPVQVVLPRGPVVVDEGWAWWPIGEAAAPEAVAAVAGLVAERRPTVLVGFSQGGAMSLLVAARTTAAPAGLAVVAGFVPDELAGAPTADHGLPPVLVAHGDADEAVDPMHGRLVARWCERAGAPAVATSTYAAGHDWVSATTAALVDWLATLPAAGG